MFLDYLKQEENIKLGILVVKSLGYEKEFEEYFKRSFFDYECGFSDVYCTIVDDYNLVYTSIVLRNNLFDLSLLSDNCVYRLLLYYPQFVDNIIKYFDLSRFSDKSVSDLIYRHPQLKTYFNKNGIKYSA